MSVPELALWGLAGGFVVEALNLVASIRKHQVWPWHAPGELGLGLYLCCVFLRLLVGAIVAGALGADQQVTGAAGAFLIGVSAPLIIRNAVQQVGGTHEVPLTDATEEAVTLSSSGSEINAGNSDVA
ncbi:hypothetical protein [Solwaraspora sp. WMMD792]|uniref:hypothetical protein n=1 Tax=Solwaraspora sp. WMMD792 TaxID=3016099 RepID=UPI0024161B7F|nr:hypothetical protein [Solwaraspora sp. WMMD792]MDG4773605.1 hypothetical protein [Solwaraspora sp. WMMD792]